MSFAQQLIAGSGIGGVIFGLSVAAAAGLALGTLKFRGFSLGVAGVLFAGLAVSDLMWRPEFATQRHAILEFVRELGLVLFVYSIGMEVGPGFLRSLRSSGLRWNLIVVTLVTANLAVVLTAHRWLSVDPVAAVGILSGAVTNTPGLAAADQAIADVPGLAPGAYGLADVGCAIAYPFGIVGAMLCLAAMRALFRWRAPSAEATNAPLGAVDLCVVNPAIAGHQVGDLAGFLGAPVVISRMIRDGAVELPAPATELREGDLLHAVGESKDLDRLAVLLGGRATVDVRSAPAALDVRELVVTRAAVVGRTLGGIDLRLRHGVTVTRIRRAGQELVPRPELDLRYGDTLVVVGEGGGLAEVEEVVGNSVRELDHPRLIPMFLGIAVGVLVGFLPIAITGLPAPVRLGLAGGPLLVAIVASHFGRIGRVSFYLPASASLMLRHLGLVLFLGCVGLMSGERFVDTLVRGPGLRWLALGAVITVVPLLTTAILARLVFDLEFGALSGVVAGSMTSPPVLAYATELGGESAAIAYGTVYPLAMVLRVITAQLLVVLWIGSPLR
jgi:putative transport protein